MNILLNLEYDLRPELSAYHRLLRQLFDVQADLQRTAFLRAARPSHISRPGSICGWPAPADLAFAANDLTAAEHLDSLLWPDGGRVAILVQAQAATDPETIYPAGPAGRLAGSGRASALGSSPPVWRNWACSTATSRPNRPEATIDCLNPQPDHRL
ncbi:MAG: hypothetical protein U0401_20250 [Anaerolineae bacterium]